MVSRKKQWIVWGTWLLVYPLLSVFAVINTNDLIQLVSWDYLFFILLGSLVAFFPIELNSKTIFLISSVSLSSYMLFGLAGEMLLTQITMGMLFLRIRRLRFQWFRFILNMLMFQVLSVCSAGFYMMMYRLVNVSGFGDWVLVFPMMTYVTVVLGMNKIINYMVAQIIFNNKSAKIEWNVLISLGTILYTVPISILMTFLYLSFGIVGATFMGIPLITVSLSMNYYYKMTETNLYLEKVNIVSQKLAGHLSLDTLIETFVEQLPTIFSITQIQWIKWENQQLLLDFSYEVKELVMEKTENTVSLSFNKLVQKVRQKDHLLIYSNASEWKVDGDNTQGESLVVLPIKHGQDFMGALVLVHRNKHAFSERELSVIEMLYNYFEIAIENTRQIEAIQHKSMTDHLTKLPNLRGLERSIKEIVETEELFSVIVIDLDYFKQVNDTYGHEAGNQLLIQVAQVLKEVIANKGMVARYGGEEFTVLLPKYSMKSAKAFSERIRERIEEQEFLVRNTLHNKKGKVIIQMTGSFGVATYPDHSKDPFEIVVLADQAMYKGAKREGRNKVSAYSNE
jgi:diguanylate cyclase (GGDEF)-like protein